MTAAADPWDVVVIGAGNAGLVAAMAARHHVARVLLLERAPTEMRGGNTRHTRNVRCMHDEGDEYTPGSYPFDELWRDLCAVGSGPGDEALAELTVRRSAEVPAWMTEHGIRWQPPLSGTLHLGRTNRFFLGGGKALINTYHRTAEAMGVTVWYDARVDDLQIGDDGRCAAVSVVVDGSQRTVPARAVVCCSGGFEANLDWLRSYWGDAADSFIIRGTPHNDGAVLACLYRRGAQSAGQKRGFHAVAVDARAPRFDGGIATRLDSIPFSVVVNRDGERFYDEGEEIWPKRYAIWGANIARQPSQIAYSIWDAKVNRLFLPPMYGPVSGASVHNVAAELGLDGAAVSATVERFNDAVGGGSFDPAVLDGRATEGLDPPKSNWAQRIDTPPFYGIAMRPGITFTYMGVAVRHDARVVRTDGEAFSNVFAAGEIMSGNILSTGYMAGFGMTIGSVWGRIAGESAARAVHEPPARASLRRPAQRGGAVRAG